MFKPSCQYSHMIDSWPRRYLDVFVCKEYIKFTAKEERFIQDENHVHYSIMAELDSRLVSFLHYPRQDNEWMRRWIQSDIASLGPLLCQTVSEEAGGILWRIFHSLYYPRYVEDEFNAWIKKSLPEFHDKTLEWIMIRNNHAVQEIMEK